MSRSFLGEQINLYEMDRNALDWLFSTLPQAIAALVGLIVASASFILGKIDDRIEMDSTLAEIGNEVKSKIYNGLKNLLYWTLGVVFIDLLCLYLNPLSNDRVVSFSGDFDFYFAVTFVFVLLNTYAFYRALDYVKKIMNPKFFDDEIKLLSEKFRDDVKEREGANTVKVGEFIEHFIEFERLLRRSELFSDKNQSRMLTMSQMVWELWKRDIIDRNTLNEIRDIIRLRNVVLHGGDVSQVKKELDDKLVEITRKLNEEENDKKEVK